MSCAILPDNAPLVKLTVTGAGEPLIRIEKRLSCAAAGSGVRLELQIRKDAEALGISPAQTPAILHDGKMIFSGLPRTEEIEDWLRNFALT